MDDRTTSMARMSRSPDIEFKVALEAAVASFGLEPLEETQTAKLVRHYAMVCQWNRRINLTRITEPEDAARLHYAESLFGARFIGTAKTMLDIGSGAGFPGIPIAVVRPGLHVTALESNQKKSLFLKEAKHELGLANFEVATTRLEDFDWSSYELLVSRALDHAEVVLPPVIEQMTAKQRLLIYCASDLVEKLNRKALAKANLETHSVPLSEERLIAIFTRE
jgi:16S rRNA (guanine527-N7)-methyltransferase